jgi:cobyrinic acid a,c-diamide synthase
MLVAERRPGVLSPAVLLAATLAQRGYSVRLFVVGTDQDTLAALQLLCGRQAAFLDPISAGSPMALRALFSEGADPGSLNLILGTLGERKNPDAPIFFTEEFLTVAEMLACPVLPIVYADTAAAVAVRSFSALSEVIASRDVPPVRAALFASALNPREYQLLDLELGRRLPWVSLGYLPKELERPSSGLQELCGDSIGRVLTPLRTASAQLQGMEYYIQWPFFGALAAEAPDWIPSASPVPPVPSRPKIAILRHQAMSPSGCGNELLFRSLGGAILSIPVEGGRIPGDADMLYVPHGLGYLMLIQLFQNAFLRTEMGGFFLSGKPVLLEGGSAPLFGEGFAMPGGKEVRGLSLLSFRARYTGPPGGVFPVTLQALGQNPLMREGEFARGVCFEEIPLSDPNSGVGCFQVTDPQGRPRGLDGQVMRRVVATRLRLDLWSCPESVRRMLLP